MERAASVYMVDVVFQIVQRLSGDLPDAADRFVVLILVHHHICAVKVFCLFHQHHLGVIQS